ncbi:hypothetical protein LY78DRAFT_197127 [Colletotrichum sublineola]|nr:hypothetical protein LY78DRAFT_197127 [Colletotrichum sublineola]
MTGNRQRKGCFSRAIYTSLIDPDLFVHIHNMPEPLLLMLAATAVVAAAAATAASFALRPSLPCPFSMDSSSKH